MDNNYFEVYDVQFIIICYTHVVACLIAIVRLEKVWSCMHPWSVRIWPLRRPSIKANLEPSPVSGGGGGLSEPSKPSETRAN